MQRSSTRDLVVGLFVLAGLVAVSYLSLRVGGLTLQQGERLVLYAHFDQTGGLKPRAPVVISGVKVGQVGAIDLDEDYRARVELDLVADLELPIDSSASILTSGLLGDRIIELQLGAEEEVLVTGETIDFTESAVILERLIGKIVTGGEL